jgi:hypothetical protein
MNATTVTLRYQDQKNGRKYQQRSHWRTRDTEFCPVRTWATIIQRIRSYPKSSDNTSINTFFDGRRISHISATDVIRALRNATSQIGFDDLGFHPEEVGTHSIRCSAAMAMAIMKVPTWQIMITGRWNSDAFMKYIREQVDRISEGVSSRMASVEEFFNIPTIDAENRSSSPLDPHSPPPAGVPQVGALSEKELESFPTMTHLFTGHTGPDEEPVTKSARRCISTREHRK